MEIEAGERIITVPYGIDRMNANCRAFDPACRAPVNHVRQTVRNSDRLSSPRGVDQMDKGNWPNRRVRHAVELDASVTLSSGAVVACKLSDFSLDGCCLSGFFNIGERVEVAVRPIGTLPAEIRWAAMGRAGARFLRRS